MQGYDNDNMNRPPWDDDKLADDAPLTSTLPCDFSS